MPHIRRVERNAPDMASKVRQSIRGIFDYAVESGLITGNPIPASRRKKGHRPCTPTGGDLQRRRGRDPAHRDITEACRGIRRAHLLAAFTGQRMGEICIALLSEFDLDRGTWTIPRERMKVKKEERGPHWCRYSPQLLFDTRMETRRRRTPCTRFLHHAAKARLREKV